MPTERFYRLPEQKKQAIHEAAIKEFAAVSFDKVSINKIIQHANISRGSFYTYFEDKQDLLDFIFEDIHRKSHQFWKESLEKNGGDFFETMDTFLDFSLDLFKDVAFFELAQNVLAHYQGNEVFYTPSFQDDEKKREHMDEQLHCMNSKGLRSMSVEEFRKLFELSMANLAMTLMLFYKGESDRSVLKERFRVGIEILKHGVMSA